MRTAILEVDHGRVLEYGSRRRGASLAEKWVAASLDWLDIAFGEGLLVAVLHSDELAPHIHAAMDPIVYERGPAGRPLRKRPAAAVLRADYQRLMAALAPMAFDSRYNPGPKSENPGSREMFYRRVREAMSPKRLRPGPGLDPYEGGEPPSPMTAAEIERLTASGPAAWEAAILISARGLLAPLEEKIRGELALFEALDIQYERLGPVARKQWEIEVDEEFGERGARTCRLKLPGPEAADSKGSLERLNRLFGRPPMELPSTIRDLTGIMSQEGLETLLGYEPSSPPPGENPEVLETDRLGELESTEDQPAEAVRPGPPFKPRETPPKVGNAKARDRRLPLESGTKGATGVPEALTGPAQEGLEGPKKKPAATMAAGDGSGESPERPLRRPRAF
jgi:hypothetical protein